MDHSELLYNFAKCKINTCISQKFRKLGELERRKSYYSEEAIVKIF